MSTVLLVEDDPETLAYLNTALQGADFTTLQAHNGEEALMCLADHINDVDAILTDVYMPNLDGYALCEIVKNDPLTCDVPLIFLSGNDSNSERIKGFDAGGDDYLVKPVELEELLHKVRNAVGLRRKYRQMAEQLDISHQIAEEAAALSSQLGVMVRFFKSMFSVNEIEPLVSELLRSTRALGLRCTLHLRLGEDDRYYGDTGVVSPLEKNIFALAREIDRFFDFGPRTIVNAANFSLLVKNMPTDDSQTVTQIKEILDVLCYGAETQLATLLSRRNASQDESVFGRINNALVTSVRILDHTRQAQQSALASMQEELNKFLLRARLDHDQERDLSAAYKRCRRKMEDTLIESLAVTKKLDALRRNVADQEVKDDE